MNKQIVAIFLMLVMIGTIFVIAPSDLQVEASGGGGDKGIGLNYSYIEEKTLALSDIVKTYHKGRAFGTKGEWAAAEKIAYWMGQLGLHDPTNTTYPDLAYREPIKRIISKFTKYLPLIPLTGKLEVLSMGIKLNGEDPIECHIRPRWNNGSWSLINKNKLTGNFSGNNLTVVHAPTNYTWFKNFIDSITDFEKFSGTSLVSFILFLIPRFEDYYNFSFSELTESNIYRLSTKYPNYLYTCSFIHLIGCTRWVG